MLQDIADRFNASVTISGGNRCFQRNMDTPGAAKGSYHVKAKASDIIVKGIRPIDVYNYLDSRYPNKFGIGLYFNRVHIDVRDSRARWDTTK